MPSYTARGCVPGLVESPLALYLSRAKWGPLQPLTVAPLPASPFVRRARSDTGWRWEGQLDTSIHSMPGVLVGNDQVRAQLTVWLAYRDALDILDRLVFHPFATHPVGERGEACFTQPLHHAPLQ